MQIAGNLQLLGGGFLQSARLENLATDPATPYVGQLWYNTTTGVYKGFDGTSVISFAIGGSTAPLQAEIDAIEAGAGLAANGAFVPYTTTNYVNSATTLANATSLLDAQVHTNTLAITAAQGVSANIQTELDNTQAGAGLSALGAYVPTVGAHYIAGATSLDNADVLLDAQVFANTGAIATANTNIATKVSKAGDTMTGNLAFGGTSTATGLAAPTLSTDAATKGYVDSAVTGLTWKNSVICMSATNVALATAGLATVDGQILVAGDRVLLTGQTNASENGVYVAATGPWVRAIDVDTMAELAGCAVFVEFGTSYANTGWTCTNKTADTLGTTAVTFIQFNGAAGIAAGVGLVKTGNTLSVGLGAGVGQLPTNEVGIDLLAAGGLFLTVDGTAASTLTNAQLSVLLDGTTLTRSVTGVKVAAGGITAAELASTVSGNGLVGGAGVALAVGAGAGISVTADAVAIDTTWLDAHSLPLAGGTLTGPLALAADPTLALQAATKQYVDAVSTRLAAGKFQYNGTVAATSHVVTHNLNSQFNSVIVYDSANKVIIPDSITADTVNQLTVTFASAITCTIIVSGVKN